MLADERQKAGNENEPSYMRRRIGLCTVTFIRVAKACIHCKSYIIIIFLAVIVDIVTTWSCEFFIIFRKSCLYTSFRHATSRWSSYALYFSCLCCCCLRCLALHAVQCSILVAKLWLGRIISTFYICIHSSVQGTLTVVARQSKANSWDNCEQENDEQLHFATDNSFCFKQFI